MNISPITPSVNNSNKLQRAQNYNMPKPAQELLDKPNYMNSKSFWKDPHNKKMLQLSDKLIEVRDCLAQYGEKYSGNYKQRMNGSLKTKKAPASIGLEVAIGIKNDAYKVIRELIKKTACNVK